MISDCIPSSVLMSCHPCTVVVPAMRHRTGCALVWWWCPPALWRRHLRHLSVRSCWRGVVVVLHCCCRACWTRICTVAPAQGARLPCTGALRACAARGAGSGGVVGWDSSGATRGRVGSGGTRGARPATICHVTRDQSLYHMPGYAWQRDSPCQLTWADGPGYFQAKK